MNKQIHGDQEEVVDVGTNLAPSLNDKKTVADLIEERNQQLEQLDKYYLFVLKKYKYIHTDSLFF